MTEAINLKIVLILTVGFGFASILGYISHRAKLSSILGYLLAGYLIGPFSPGFTADLQLSEQLAEIGVILMMFGVGLQFKWQDLMSTTRIAIPGAIGQTLIATVVSALFIYHQIGWSLESGIIFGLAVGVASTVVLVHVLADNKLINTSQGHIAVGWLIVEDLITVAALLLIPLLAASTRGENIAFSEVAFSFGMTLLKFTLLALVIFTVGKLCVSYVFSKVLQTHSHELFTLTILAITFFIAVGSTLLLGTSIALGSFIAGMAIGQTGMRQQVSLHATPLKDAFVVVFFLSIGMLFNPAAVYAHFLLFLGVLAIILIVKPLSALIITLVFKYPIKTAVTVALALAQIGEFSFILAEEAMKFKLLPEDGFDIIVACALVSIALNPLLFRALKSFEKNQVSSEK